MRLPTPLRTPLIDVERKLGIGFPAAAPDDDTDAWRQIKSDYDDSQFDPGAGRGGRSR
jgi:hypothetical protein